MQSVPSPRLFCFDCDSMLCALFLIGKQNSGRVLMPFNGCCPFVEAREICDNIQLQVYAYCYRLQKESSA